MSHIRRAIPNDAFSFLEIKEKMPMPSSMPSTLRGGFLLGTNLATYIHFIQNDHCLVCEKDGTITGFGICFADESFRKSTVWKRRHNAKWLIDVSWIESKRLCYFEQLAFLKGEKKSILILVYNLVNLLFAEGHDALITTTVLYPVENRSALPFLLAAGGSLAGIIEENYPVIGNITSSIYILEKHTFYKNLNRHRLGNFLKKNTILL